MSKGKSIGVAFTANDSASIESAFLVNHANGHSNFNYLRHVNENLTKAITDPMYQWELGLS